MLLRHQSDPGRKTAPRGECLPVADLGDQCGGSDRADARDLRQPTARLAAAVQGHDALVDGCYLGADGTILPRQHFENAAHGEGHPAIRTTRDNPVILSNSAVPLRPLADTMPSQGVAQHRAVAHQQLSGPVQHQGALLLLRLDRDEPPRRPCDRLADRTRRGCRPGILLSGLKRNEAALVVPR